MSTFDLNFRHYPNIRSLDLQRTHFYIPTVAYLFLRHLKLKHCTIRPSPAAGNVPALRAMHNALEFFPNLESLSISRSLMGGTRSPCELTKSIHLPHLRLLEIEDIPVYIPRSLSHLVSPPTTSLILAPEYRIYHPSLQPTTPVPLFPGIAGSLFPSPCPTAELSLHLDFRGAQYDRVAAWETAPASAPSASRSSAARPTSDAAVVARFTRELAAALAPAPALGVTSLASEGTCRARGCGYWEQLLRGLPGLRRLSCHTMWAAKLEELRLVVGVLGQRQPELGDEFPCAHLEEVGLGRGLPDGIRDSVLGREEWRPLQEDGGQHGGPEPESLLAASLSEFCDTLRVCFSERAGHCALIRKLSVSLHWDERRNSARSVTVLEEWQVALVEQRLRHALGRLVGDVTVGSEIN